MSRPARVLICDLNNFARYPTVSVGYLSALLRKAGYQVEVFSPWSKGVGGVAREAPVRPWGSIDQRMRYWSAMTSSRVVRTIRSTAQKRFFNSDLNRQSQLIESSIRELVSTRPSIVLISTYLMYFGVVTRVCAMCREAGIPVIVGGPYFAEPAVRRDWESIPGLTALSVAESEFELTGLVDSVLTGRGLNGFETFSTRDSPAPVRPPPLRSLDALPYPDYSDFPWHRYPQRIVPIITGRGCGWGACRFCSDVTSTAGRSYRSRSLDNVIGEIEHQCARHEAKHLVFTDLKLNSNPAMWHGLIDHMSRSERDIRWIASIHIDADPRHALDKGSIRAAAATGMARLTTGVESGSQRVLDLMKKGTKVSETSQILRIAAAAGISVRVTVIVGYPGEQPSDIEETARFLEDHLGVIERVSLNRFTIMSGTVIDRLIQKRPDAFDSLRVLQRSDREATVDHVLHMAGNSAYRPGLWRVLNAVHRINRRPLTGRALEFQGVM